MRPRSLAEFVGQEEVIGAERPLRRMIEGDELSSIILWGPPGSGKTTLASIVAAHTERYFAELSAVTSGVADVRRLIEEARERERISGRRTILFIDELHRFNRAQQDALLPHVEAGTVTLIGATTENPSFYVVGPLLSRCRVFRLELLGPEDLVAIVRAAVADAERGLGGRGVAIDEDALRVLPELAAGDARTALNLVEVTARITKPSEDGGRRITREALEGAAQHPTLLYDRMGDAHYDTVSAFIKTVRDSDPDGALYWLARMLEAGEDPMFVVRRLVILAAEDVGLADPQALPLAVACQQAVHFLGMPEARLPLAETTVYLARAPKSNSAYVAYGRAQADAERTRNDAVPLHLRNAATGLMKELGYGTGYRYAHDEPGHVAAGQAHRPASVEGNVYYVAGELGAEPGIGGGATGGAL
jgi:putative ATPase